MADQKFGFRDLRTAAELAMAPGVPASVKVGQLHLNALLPIPQTGKIGAVVGQVQKASDLTGSAFQTYRATIQLVKELKSLASEIKTALDEYDQQAKRLLRGELPIDDISRQGSTMIQRGLNGGGFFAPEDLVQLSGFKPGILSPEELRAAQLRLDQRRKDLQAMYVRVQRQIVSLLSKGPNGSSIRENYQRSPNPQSDGPSIPAFAQGGDAVQASQIIQDKRANEVKGIPIGSGTPSFWGRLVSTATDALKGIKKNPFHSPITNTTFTDRANQAGWSEPSTDAQPQSPYNDCTHTRSGHLFELDDTPDHERIHVYHRAGSFIEFHPDGQVVYKSTANSYIISMRDQHIHAAGACHVHVGGDATLHIGGNLEIEGKKDVNIKADGTFRVRASEIDMGAKTKAKLDGTLIDLRYLQLPGIPVAGFNGIAPSLSLSALKADFPDAGSSLKEAQEGLKGDMSAAKSAASSVAGGFNPMAPINSVAGSVSAIGKIAKVLATAAAIGGTVLAFKKLTANDAPQETALSNPLVYSHKTVEATNYRTLLLDTPEEMSDATLHQSHIGMRKTLGDIANTYTNHIGGKRTVVPITTANTLPTVDYLDREAFTGHYSFTPDTTLGGTTFTVKQLVDSLAYPDVANFITPEDPTPDPS